MPTTRSVAHRLQTARELESNQPSHQTRSRTHTQGLTCTSTQVDITPSNTGQGTHIRWIRPTNEDSPVTRGHETANGATVDNAGFVDNCFVTPPPLIQQATPAAPRRVVQRRNSALGGLHLNIPENLGRDLIQEMAELEAKWDAEPMCCPISNTFLSLDGENPLIDDDQSTPFLASPFSESSTSIPQRMLGPHGTYLTLPSPLDTIMEGDNCEGGGANPLPPVPPSPSPDVTMSSPQNPRGLGPFGTILVGRDGQAIVPGLRPGY